MPALIIPERYRSQPQRLTAVDARVLHAVNMALGGPGRYVDSRNRAGLATVSGSDTLGRRFGEMGAYQTMHPGGGSSGCLGFYFPSSHVVNAGNFSAVCVVRQIGSFFGNNGALIGRGGGSDSIRSYLYNATTARFSWIDNSPAQYDLDVTIPTVTAGSGWHRVGITKRGTTRTLAVLHANGTLSYGTQTSGGATGRNDNTGWNWGTFSAAAPHNDLAHFAVFADALSDDELIAHLYDPYRIYRQSKTLFFSAGGGATDIAGALESISLATFGATVGSARDIAGALESLSLTPYAATVSSARAITAAVESISLGTYAATVSRDTALAGGLESIALTANAASITLGAAIAAAMEAIVLAANPAAVRLDAAIAAQLEAITITGLGATISTSSDVNIGAALESITLSVPQALVSSNRTITGGLESIQITANGATVTLGAIIQAALESIALQSYGAGITLDVALPGGLEQINLTTLAAQIGLGSNVAALVEAITLTPHGATLTMTGEITAALESIGLTTFVASVVGGESALTTPGLEFTIPVGRMHFTVPIGRIHFTIPRD